MSFFESMKLERFCWSWEELIESFYFTFRQMKTFPLKLDFSNFILSDVQCLYHDVKLLVIAWNNSCLEIIYIYFGNRSQQEIILNKLSILPIITQHMKITFSKSTYQCVSYSMSHTAWLIRSHQSNAFSKLISADFLTVFLNQFLMF